MRVAHIYAPNITVVMKGPPPNIKLALMLSNLDIYSVGGLNPVDRYMYKIGSESAQPNANPNRRALGICLNGNFV